MGRKIHRGHRSSYGRRYNKKSSAWVQVVAWVVAAVILIPGSFFVARWIDQGKQNVPASQNNDTTASTTVQSTTATTTQPSVVGGEQVLRGFTLPYTKLRDVKALKTLAEQAVKDGYNSVVIELKDRDGNLYYVSETEAGKQADAQVAKALTLKKLTDAFAVLDQAGLTPVPLLYAFEDAKAPITVPGAMVTLEGNTQGRWHDDDPSKGGRPWLNPYADAAQAYIVALGEELKLAGAGAVMLDGVYFPTQTLHADFKSGGDASLSEAQVLKNFLSRMATACGVPIMLRCDVNATLGNNLGGYHKNPLGFGASAVVTDLRMSSIGDMLVVKKKMLTVSDEAMSDIASRVFDALTPRFEKQPTQSRPASVLLLGGESAKQQITALTQKDDGVSYIWDGYKPAEKK